MGVRAGHHRYRAPVTEVARRARSPRDREFRRVALLRAASELAAERGVRDVTLAAVTTRVGLHPSALRRYFASREELLLELTQQGWRRWRDLLVAQVGALDDPTPERIAGAVADSLERLPTFCDLLAHVVLGVEGGVSVERAREYRLAAAQARDAMVEAMVGAGLDRSVAALTLDAAQMAAAHLYQLSRPTPTLLALYEEHPRWAHDALRFRERLTEVLVAVVRGAEPR